MEACLCFPYGYNDKENTNPDRKTFRMTTHALSRSLMQRTD